MENDQTRGYEKFILGWFILAFTLVIIRAAYVCDDAYITFRTVENFLHGYGLTYNVGERVQAFTHPLWMFIISAVYGLINGVLKLSFESQLYYISIGISLVCSLAAILFYALKIARNQTAALFGVGLLTLSKAFTDYSTSGLENPLSHLLLVVFFLIYLKDPAEGEKAAHRRLTWLVLLTSLGFLNRADTLLLYLPPLLVAVFRVFRSVKWRVVWSLLLGATPALAWLIFSVIYYGFPFPNTYYAKLSTGIAGGYLAKQGLIYFVDTIQMDPITLLGIALAFITALFLKRKEKFSILAGISPYLFYVISIGGDFMAGRFLAAPLLVAVIYLSTLIQPVGEKAIYAVLALAVVLSLGVKASPIWGNAYIEAAASRKDFIDTRGVADERAFYFHKTGLVYMARNFHFPDSPVAGSRWIQTGRWVEPQQALGFYGYEVGPSLHLVDYWALVDPLLAHLPVNDPIGWRIGHFTRTIPDGYLETLDSGRNQIKQPSLAAYYDKLALVVQAPLFAPGRWTEIWRLNTGYYDALIRDYQLSEVKTP